MAYCTVPLVKSRFTHVTSFPPDPTIQEWIDQVSEQIDIEAARGGFDTAASPAFLASVCAAGAAAKLHAADNPVIDDTQNSLLQEEFNRGLDTINPTRVESPSAGTASTATPVGSTRPEYPAIPPREYIL